MADTATVLNVYRWHAILQWIAFVQMLKYTTADDSVEYAGHGEQCEVLV